MATIKQGLDYFPLDVGFYNNDKVQLVSARFGLRSELILIRLFCKIYANGYYCRFGEDEIILFCKQLGDGMLESAVEDMLNEMIRRELFDKNIYEKYSILTSAAIQRRYLEAIFRRKKIEIYEQLLLIDDPKLPNVYILDSNAYIINQNGDIRRQKKGKEKEISENESEQAHICASERARTCEEEPEKLSDHAKFTQWIKTYAPFCAQRKNFPNQITETQLKRLKKKYTAEEIAFIIEQIENRKDLRQKYTNLYTTVVNWAEKEYGK